MKTNYKILGYFYLKEDVLNIYLSDCTVNRLVTLTLLKHTEKTALLSYKIFNREAAYDIVSKLVNSKAKFYLPTEELLVSLDIDTSECSYNDIEIEEFTGNLKDLGYYFLINGGSPTSLFEKMYFKETDEFEEYAHIKGYSIFDNIFCIYVKLKDSTHASSIVYSYKTINFQSEKPNIGCIECQGFNEYELSNPSIIRHPNIPLNNGDLIVRIPKEKEFLKFYKLNSPGIDLENNKYNPSLLVINNVNGKDIILPTPILEEAGVIVDKVDDEIQEYKKEISELKEDIRCLMRIIKKYGMEEF